MADGFSETEIGSICQPCPLQNQDKEKPVHWVSISLVSEDGKPQAWEEYRIKLSNGDMVRGYLNKDGKAKVSSIQDFANCEITFPGIDKDAWTR